MMKVDKEKWFSFLIGFGILLPMFFTLNGGIYRNKAVMSDSGGVITALPLPVSILVCLIGLLLMIGRIREARVGLAMVVGTTAVLLFSLWVGADNITSPYQKLIRIIQVILPLAGLLVGQLIKDDGKQVALAFLIVITIIAPLQLYFPLVNSPWDQTTWGHASLQYSDLLSDNIQIFTIYAHIQYVALIMVFGYAYALYVLANKYKLWVLFCSVVMLIYSSRSFSFLTITAYMLVAISFLFVSYLGLQKRFKLYLLVVGMVAIAIVPMSIYFDISHKKPSFISNSANATYAKIKPILNGELPSNVQERIGDWSLFGQQIIESPKSFFIGRPEPMPREIRTSPHNWYIDIVHTFGFVGILPILFLIGYTGKGLWQQRKYVSSETWWLTGIVFYLVVIDSNFKVTLRQPYPGIFAFFMWGMLLTQLGRLKADRVS